MNKRNLVLAIVAFIILGWVLFKGLATAWVALKLLPFVGILLAFVIVAWLWGRFSR
jgi:hypothetical protein